MKKKYLLITLFVFMILSIANNYYASQYMSLYSDYYLKALIWYIAGFLIILVLSKININYLINKSLYLYLLGILLLIITLIWGTNVNGAKCWLSVGMFTFQPSEFMKIFLILYLYYISSNWQSSDFKYFIFVSIIVFIPCILTFLEPDTGPVIFYLIIYLSFLLLKKINKYYVISLILIASIIISGFLILYFKYQDLFINIFGSSFFYRIDRLTNFVKMEGYQITMALTSTANAGITGNDKIVYFPEAPTDFAFSLYISNFGMIGLIFLLIVYTLFFYYLLSISENKLLLYPIFFIIFFHYVINIFMNIGLFPIIGITLPFISYGGSSLITYMFLVGILINDNHENL